MLTATSLAELLEMSAKQLQETFPWISERILSVRTQSCQKP